MKIVSLLGVVGLGLMMPGVKNNFTNTPVNDPSPVYTMADDWQTVPVGGNSWVTKPGQSKEEVRNDGWRNWQNSEAVFSTFVKLDKPGSLQVAIVANAGGNNATVEISINGKAKKVKLSGDGEQSFEAGEWQIPAAGYVQINCKGVQKTGSQFATVTALKIKGTAVDTNTQYVKNNEGNFFYWGRRGPSVHLNYDLNKEKNIEWYYSEITVPKDNDVIGSYYMANGFGEGYFGMQVNAASERRVLFSVWSPFSTDNPKEIPDDHKILLLKKGKEVNTGEFGNEGSGGQSFLRFNWKAGNTYKFLLHGVPAANNYTNYTAYFFASEEGKWRLIASFSRPKTSTYLTRFHSFLENFNPATGNISRKAYYHNQWMRTATGEWKAVDKVKVTVDNTGRKKYRLDYDGGVENNMPFMRNCGFFNSTMQVDGVHNFTPSKTAPVIDFTALD